MLFLMAFDVKYELCSFLYVTVRDLLGTFVLIIVYDVTKILVYKDSYVYFLLWQCSEERPSNPPQRKLSRQ